MNVFDLAGPYISSAAYNSLMDVAPYLNLDRQG